MTLNDIKKGCEEESALLKVSILDEEGKEVVKPFNTLSDEERKKNIRQLKRYITNLYCDYDEKQYYSNDEAEKDSCERYKSACWAAVLLMYWGKIYDWMMNSKSLGLRETDFFDWLDGSVHDAFYYRSWRKKRRVKPNDPNSEWMDNPQYVEDENAADKSINFFCGARRGKEYQAANKDKRRANYQSLSIDGTFDEDGYSILDRKGLSVSGEDCMGVKGLVNQLLQDNKILEAIIVDGIANGDSFKETKTKMSRQVKSPVTGEEETETYYKYSYDFNARRLVKFLTTMDQEYFMKSFAKEYNLKNPEEALKKLKSIPNNKLYKEIEKTIIVVKNTPELLGFVM